MSEISEIFVARITDVILKAKRHGDITRQEADYLVSMATDSPAATSTRALLSQEGAPDFSYAALHFAAKVWRMGDADENDIDARAGYMLAQYVLTQELHETDAYWAAKLLREVYNSQD